jgi:conjugal transfer/entry exclusion protein
MEPERRRLRELSTEEIWQRFLTAVRSLEEAEQQIEALTTQLAALRARVAELESREAEAVAEIDRLLDRLQAFGDARGEEAG